MLYIYPHLELFTRPSNLISEIVYMTDRNENFIGFICHTLRA